MSQDGATDGEPNQSDLVHDRLRESPFERWVLLDGDRLVLTALLSFAVFAICFGVGLAGFVPVTDPGVSTTLVAAVVGGTLPFVTIVLAINQLVLAQELGWAGELEERFDAMTSFRRAVETATGTGVSPAAPADFLDLIVRTVADRAETLRPVADRIDDPVLATRVEDFADAITTESEVITDALDDAEFGTFDALSAMLGHFNGAHLYTARSLRTWHAVDLPEEARETFDSLIDLLGHLAVARQTFKTLYIEYELAHLSKLLLYVGLPTLLGGGLYLLTYGSIVEAVGDPLVLLLVVSTVVTLVFLPFVVLLVYTLRIATIASRTADFGPFVPRAESRQ